MILILAYGNELRGDDGAGLALGEEIETAFKALSIPCELIRTRQLLPEHAEEIARPNVEAVVFCDTRDCRDLTEAKVEIRRTLAEATATPAGHSFSPQALLATARSLYRATPPAWLVTVPGWSFDHGSQWSDKTAGLFLSLSPLVGALLAEILTEVWEKQKVPQPINRPKF
jgi:hydrogenase maturation protease